MAGDAGGIVFVLPLTVWTAGKKIAWSAMALSACRSDLIASGFADKTGIRSLGKLHIRFKGQTAMTVVAQHQTAPIVDALGKGITLLIVTQGTVDFVQVHQVLRAGRARSK